MFLTAEQEALVQTVTDYCRRTISPALVRRWDETEHYPQEIMDGLAELGLMSLLVAPAHGGTGAGPGTIGLVVETLSYHSLAVGQAFFSLYILGADAIARLGTEEQKARYLPEVASGRLRIAFALTEPNAGSDGAGITTAARPGGDGWLVCGQKTFITGAKHSDIMITVVRTDPAQPRGDGISLLILDPHDPTVTLRPLAKLGLRAVDFNEVYFDATPVPAANLLGPYNGGWRSLLEGLSRERYYLSCVAVGAAQCAVDQACEQARGRIQFGQPISKFQMTQQKLVDMQMNVDAGRLLTRQAGALLGQGINCARESAMAKIFTSETYTMVAREAVQIFGGSGFTMETPAQLHYRDCKYLEIGGGTSEVLRLLVAKRMGL